MDQTINNTFPPLISQNSFDVDGRHHIYGNATDTSLTIEKSTLDPFFNPDINFTGFASNGTHYTAGVQDTIVPGFSVDRINEGISNNGIIASIQLNDNRILFIEDHNGTVNKTGTINPYTNVLEYTATNLINNYPAQVNKTVHLVKNSYDTIIGFGGLDKTTGAPIGTQVKSIIGFNPITNQWFTYSSVFPTDISGFKTFSMPDGKILIIGGYEGLSPIPTTVSYIFDPLVDKLTTINTPVLRTDFIIWHANDNELWLIGGRDTTNLTNDTSTILIYNLSTNMVNTSTMKLPNSTGLYNCRGNVYGDTMYIWGGREVSTTNSSAYLYTITSGGICQRQPIANTRYGYTSYLDANTLYIFSGFNGSSTLVDTVIAYSIPLNTETNIGSITARSYSNDIVKVDNRFFILGSDEVTKSTDIMTYLTVAQPVYASWYVENPSMYRGIKRIFPDKTLVLSNKDGVSILDIDNNFNVWLNTIQGQNLLIQHNPLGFGTDLISSSIEYGRGVIAVSYKMTGHVGVYVLYLDFARDVSYTEFNIV